MAFVLLGAGCGEDKPPAPGGLDGGDFDATPQPDAAGFDAGGRPDGTTPVLPPADIDVVLPYLGPVVTHEIEVEADLFALDVHFSIDTTGSFGEEIDAMQADLDGRIIPSIRSRVRDVAFGVSRFEDFPEAPFGGAGDSPFRLLSPITTSRARTGAAVAALDQPLGNGGDALESGAEALYQIATGEGLRVAGTTYVERWNGMAAEGGGTLGGVGFRDGALHVVVHVTDAPTHEPGDYAGRFPGTHSVSDAVDALGAVGARVIGIASGDVARPHLETAAIRTSATTPVAAGGGCPTAIDGGDNPPVGGVCPLVFDVARDGTGLSEAIVDAIVELVNGVQFAEAWGEAVDDRLDFVQAIEASRAVAPAGVTAPSLADRRPPDDGVDDTFVDVRTGTHLTFTVLLRNESIPPADYDQVFRLSVRILGDGLLLARVTIRVTVPFGRLDAGAPDAAAPDTGQPDAATSDAGTPDAGTPDASGVDAGTDAATSDGGPADAG